MHEQLPRGESNEEIELLIERLRDIYFNISHPLNKPLSEDLVSASHLHPEWVTSSRAWHRLIGSTVHPNASFGFDTPDRAVSAFIKSLADKYFS